MFVAPSWSGGTSGRQDRVNDIFGGQGRRTERRGTGLLRHIKSPWRFAGFALIAVMLAGVGVVWFQHGDTVRQQTLSERLNIATGQVAAYVSQSLNAATAIMAKASTSNLDIDDMTVEWISPESDNQFLTFAQIGAFASSSSANSRLALTAPFLRNGHWYAGLIGSSDIPAVPVVMIPLAQLGTELDTVARALEVEILITSIDDRVWWMSPLDDGALNLPIGETTAERDNNHRRLDDWLADHASARWHLESAGLEIFARAKAAPSSAPPHDYVDGMLILVTGLSAILGCAMAISRPEKGRFGMPRTSDAAVLDGSPTSLGALPILTYQVSESDSGDPVIALAAGRAFEQFGLDAPRTYVTAKDLVERCGCASSSGFAKFLQGRSGPEDTPQWVIWQCNGQDSRTLLHHAFSGETVETAGVGNAGLLVPADGLRAAWQNLQDVAQDAHAANISKSRFLARLSHELRTPLNAIIGFSALMEAETYGPIGSQRYKGYLADIGASGHHLRDLINDIIDISRVETGELELSESALPVHEELQACIRLIGERLDASRLTFRLDVPDALPQLMADPLRFRQIMLNLLSNSIKFTPPGGRIHLTVSINEDGSLKIALIDSGIGMTPEGVRRAMEPFGRLTEEHHRPTEGTGLGLPIARGLVGLHGGKLDIESKLGGGTTVTVVFPARRLIAST